MTYPVHARHPDTGGTLCQVHPTAVGISRITDRSDAVTCERCLAGDVMPVPVTLGPEGGPQFVVTFDSPGVITLRASDGGLLHAEGDRQPLAAWSIRVSYPPERRPS